MKANRLARHGGRIRPAPPAASHIRRGMRGGGAVEVERRRSTGGSPAITDTSGRKGGER
jgi:hypothetical protein